MEPPASEGACNRMLATRWALSGAKPPFAGAVLDVAGAGSDEDKFAAKKAKKPRKSRAKVLAFDLDACRGCMWFLCRI